jgi:hypothetical protein
MPLPPESSSGRSTTVLRSHLTTTTQPKTRARPTSSLPRTSALLTPAAPRNSPSTAASPMTTPTSFCCFPILPSTPRPSVPRLAPFRWRPPSSKLWVSARIASTPSVPRERPSSRQSSSSSPLQEQAQNQSGRPERGVRVSLGRRRASAPLQVRGVEQAFRPALKAPTETGL